MLSNVGHRPVAPTGDEFLPQLTFHVGASALLHRLAFDEILGDSGERVFLPALPLDPLPLDFALRVDTLGDELEPGPRLGARSVERQRAILAERAGRWIATAGIAGHQNEGQLAFVRDPHREPGDNAVPDEQALAGGSGLERFQEPIGQDAFRHRINRKAGKGAADTNS